MRDIQIDRVIAGIQIAGSVFGFAFGGTFYRFG